jgi:predicted nucleotidyltransferase
MRRSAEFNELIDTLKIAVATLRDRGVPFVLGGSLAAWARGGPEPQNDLDLMLKPADADTALEALGDVGMRVERPPEEWLYKAWRDEVMIDVIFKPAGFDVTDELLERANTISVAAVATPVMALEDVLVTMLWAIDEHMLDYSRLVAIARAVREQIDWPQLEGRTTASPYARAFFTLVRGLGIAPPQAGAHHGGGPSRVRVLPGGP